MENRYFPCFFFAPPTKSRRLVGWLPFCAKFSFAAENSTAQQQRRMGGCWLRKDDDDGDDDFSSLEKKGNVCVCVLAIHTEAKRKLILGADLWSKIKMNNVLGRGWVTLLCVCGEVFSLTRGVLHLVKVQISTTFLSPFP